jgi:hypothetical protein
MGAGQANRRAKEIGGICAREGKVRGGGVMCADLGVGDKGGEFEDWGGESLGRCSRIGGRVQEGWGVPLQPIF